MIAVRADGPRLPRLIWRRSAKRSLSALTDFIERGGGDAKAHRRRIEDAVESLRQSPLRCAVVGVKGRVTYRRLVVDERFLVYYVFTPPRGMTSGGTLSIRSVKHAASQNPFLDVREELASNLPLGALSTRDSTEPATA